MKILIGIDFSESTEKIAKKTEEIATALSANIWLLHVAEPELDCIAFKEGLQSERDFLAKKFHKIPRGALPDTRNCRSIS